MHSGEINKNVKHAYRLTIISDEKAVQKIHKYAKTIELLYSTNSEQSCI